MNILLISYGIKEYDGRLKELYSVCRNLGKVTFVSCGEEESNKTNENVILIQNSKYMSIYLYFKFIITCLSVAKKMDEIDILVVDNFFSAFPALLIKSLFRPKYIVQDVRELYDYDKIKNISGKIFYMYEKKMIKKANVVLCANKQRSEIMYEKYRMNEKPIIFENIRFLNDKYNKFELDKKYNNYFNHKINIVSTGGLSVLRTTDKLVSAMAKIPSDYYLYILGDGTDEDKEIINSIIKKENMKNILLLDKVPLSELRYIVKRCDIGIVNYHKKDLNNKYCASGKVYEYLAEGLPIVTTENIPLKKFTEEYNLGASDDSFYNGILKVSNDLNNYKKRVDTFISSISVEKYNVNTALNIMNKLEDRKNL